MIADLSVYGYIPLGSGINNSSILSVRPNLTFKYLNWDFNLAYDQMIMGKGVDYGFSVQLGATYKLSFEYPKIFTLLLLTKIDPEELDKKKDLKNVETGKNLYINNCAKCHVLVNPDEYKYDKWQPIVGRYREKKIISKTEEKALLEFLESYTEEQLKK